MLHDDYIVELNELKKMNDTHKKYHHVRSIENFLRYLESIENKDQKFKAIKLIQSYFLEIKDNPVFDLEGAQNIFKKYITPLGNIYSDYLGFVPHMRFWVLIIWFLIFEGFAFLFTQSLIVKSIVIMLFALLILYKIYKLYLGKTFGFLW